MKRQLQQHVAKKFEEAGFIAYGEEIRFANNSAGIRKVVCTVIQRLMKCDPERIWIRNSQHLYTRRNRS